MHPKKVTINPHVTPAYLEFLNMMCEAHGIEKRSKDILAQFTTVKEMPPFEELQNYNYSQLRALLHRSVNTISARISRKRRIEKLANLENINKAFKKLKHQIVKLRISASLQKLNYRRLEGKYKLAQLENENLKIRLSANERELSLVRENAQNELIGWQMHASMSLFDIIKEEDSDLTD